MLQLAHCLYPKNTLLTQLWVVTLVVVGSWNLVQASADLSGKFSTGVAHSTTHKPQSKLWFHDGSWWSIIYDGNNQRIWKFENQTFVKQTYADALVDSRSSARMDVRWDGTYLYVLTWHSTLPRFSKFSYDSSNQTWTLLPGFPIDLPIAGTEVMTLDLDTLGRAWISFELASVIRVIWSTSPDHLNWNIVGTILDSDIASDDITTTVAFGDKMGVFWSDQNSWKFGFRYHNDADPPEVWSPLEVPDTGSSVDDHIHATCDDQGNVFVVTKDTSNHANVYRRASSGTWSRIGANIRGGLITRPNIVVDDLNQQLVVFLTDWETAPNSIYKITAPLNTFTWSTPQLCIPAQISNLNNVTTTKEHLSANGGLMAMASSSGSAYWAFTNYDVSSPKATPLYPVADQGGVPLDSSVQVTVSDAGMGVDINLIVMQIDGVVVPTTITGTSASYVVSWNPPAALFSNQVYSVRIDATDRGIPPLSRTATYQFKTQPEPNLSVVKTNFQPQAETPPTGYTPDWGQEYSLTRGRGWNKGTITGRVANANPNALLDTYVDRKNSWGIARFDYDVANGLYEVTIVAGSPINNGKHRVEIEGDVLLNGQTTAANQFITISDYSIAVTDGQLSLFMGAAGGRSTKTQICYFEFRYVGNVPPPPPPGEETLPMPVSGLTIQAQGSDLLLQWDAVSTDTAGATVPISHYNVYRGTTPNFAADRAGKTNRVGIVAQPAFSDLAALNLATNYFYYVTAERSGGAESLTNSELGIRRHVQFDPAPDESLTTWIAIPSQPLMATASGLAANINGNQGAGSLVKLRRHNAATQLDEIYAWDGSQWNGTDFPIQPGEAYEITLAAPHGWNVIGVQGTIAPRDFVYHTLIANVNWIGLPQTASYPNAQSLAASFNAGTPGSVVTKIARRNPQTGAMESLVFFAGDWRGTNFILEDGIGVAVMIRADFPQWVPSLQ